MSDEGRQCRDEDQEPTHDEWTENAAAINDLWTGGKIGLVQKYLDLSSTVRREGYIDFLIWLNEKTDFYRAPASANGHNNYDGGLVEHSLKVYYNLLNLSKAMGYMNIPRDALIIVALTHDVCKANFYKESTRNKKDELTGKWYSEPYFTIEDQFPAGHGEKSVIILQQFIKLTIPETLAIRWHMGGFDDSARSYAGGLSMTRAFQEFPLCVLLHTADLLACYPEEKGG